MTTDLEQKRESLTDYGQKHPNERAKADHLLERLDRVANLLNFLPDTARLDFDLISVTFSAEEVILVSFDENGPDVPELEARIGQALAVELEPATGREAELVRTMTKWDGVLFITFIWADFCKALGLPPSEE